MEKKNVSHGWVILLHGKEVVLSATLDKDVYKSMPACVCKHIGDKTTDRSWTPKKMFKRGETQSRTTNIIPSYVGGAPTEHGAWEL